MNDVHARGPGDFPEARAIKQENVLLVGPFPEGRPLADPSSPLRVGKGFRRCNIALLIAWPGFRTPYPALARMLHSNRIPFSLILCGLPMKDDSTGALAAFFPLEDPSPCWRCLELRWLGWAGHVPRGLAWLESLQFPDLSPPPRTVPPTEEERVMLSWTAMDVLGADAGTARAVSDDGSFTIHTFLPHPQCSWCSPWAGRKLQRDRRSMPVRPVVDPVLGLLRPGVGTRLSPALNQVLPSGPDPVFLEAVRRGGAALQMRRLLIANASPYFAPEDGWSGEISLTCSGDTPAQLQLDGIAAYAVRLRAGRPLWRGTRRGVALASPNPRNWIFPLLGAHPTQTRFSEDLELDWARGHDLQSGDALGIPADLVFDGPPRDGLAFADASGAVAHPQLVVAVRWALSRVAENDALMATWYIGLPPPRVPASALPDAYAAAAAEAEEQGIQLAVLDLTTDLGVPVLAVVGRTRDWWFYGCGAGMIPERALRAAWARLAQSYLRHLPNPGPCIDFLFTGPLRDFPAPVPGGDTDPIDTWRLLLAIRSMQALWIDITPPDVELAGIAVTRAWVAGTLPRPPGDVRLDLDPDFVSESLGGVRLLELPMRMGLSEAPLEPEGLNTAPHPFL